MTMTNNEVTGDEIAYSSLTCVAPINIAVVKYWGKRDENYNLPLHSSLSITLGLDELASKTTILVSTDLTEDEFWLNGKKMPSIGTRMKRCLDEVRRQWCKRKREGKDNVWLHKAKLKIESANNFPTAAGLASSASGFAALAYGLGKLFHIQGDLSQIARIGSGSACRSMLGGFVRWEKGECPYGSDSIAKQVASENHWPELRVLILVVQDSRKEIGSTDGMKLSADTSSLLEYRATHIVPKRMKQMEKAIHDRHFQAFAELTMKESNQFHAICQDTYPPIEPPYLAPVSHDIIQIITELNVYRKEIRAGYTFDAGPNAFVFTLEEHLEEVVATICSVFGLPSKDESERQGLQHLFKGLPLPFDRKAAVLEVSSKIFDRRRVREAKDGIKYIIHTKPGQGPKIIGDVAITPRDIDV